MHTLALSLLLTGALAHAAKVTGTVTDKTTGKPASGDQVVLVDVQAQMGEVAKTTTDERGHYSLNTPGTSNYLVRVTHQGSTYFIAAPQGGAPGDLTVYDVTAKVQGVFVEADVLELETENGQLAVTERYFVHNPSSPPVTQWSPRSFEVVLPGEAVIDGAEAQRPSGIPTSLHLDPDGPKGHYAFNFPIQPDDGEKQTQFSITYHLPYSGEKFTFKNQATLQTDNVGVILPKNMTFAAAAGSSFKLVPQDPNVQTFVAKGAGPGKTLEFTVSGSGSLPREQQGAATAQPQGMGAQEGGTPAQGNQPGGGIGTPINTPDPLSKYKWWILGGLALLLAAAAAFLLRKPTGALTVAGGANATPNTPILSSPASKQTALLNALKEELFTVESEKISGTLSQEEYAEQKAALETVLRRALKRHS